MLPQAVKERLREHLARVKMVHGQDLADGYGRVRMPDALDRKVPNAPAEWRWQWVLPQGRRRVDSCAGEQGRRHVHDSG